MKRRRLQEKRKNKKAASRENDSYTSTQIVGGSGLVFKSCNLATKEKRMAGDAKKLTKASR
jgi:hypothetical protein